MPKKTEKIIYENETNGVKAIEIFNPADETTAYVVRHGLKEMCPTSDKSFALIFAKGYERGLAEGKKLKE